MVVVDEQSGERRVSSTEEGERESGCVVPGRVPGQHTFPPEVDPVSLGGPWLRESEDERGPICW